MDVAFGCCTVAAADCWSTGYGRRLVDECEETESWREEGAGQTAGRGTRMANARWLVTTGRGNSWFNFTQLVGGLVRNWFTPLPLVIIVYIYACSIHLCIYVCT